MGMKSMEQNEARAKEATMRQQTIDGILVTRPTRQDIAALEVGDLAPDCFGGMSVVTEIFGRGEDIHGDLYVCYYTKHGENGAISGSMTQDETVPTVPVTRRWQRAQSATVVGAEA